jgi:hypothetical protein
MTTESPPPQTSLPEHVAPAPIRRALADLCQALRYGVEGFGATGALAETVLSRLHVNDVGEIASIVNACNNVSERARRFLAESIDAPE